MVWPTAIAFTESNSSNRGIRLFQATLCLTALLHTLGCGAQDRADRHVEHELAALSTAAAADVRDAKAPAADRKLIYKGDLRLAVKSLEKTELEIKRLLTAADGQLAEFREERAIGNQRAASWKVRVPPAKFNSFVEGVAGLGIPELREVQTADVTEEFIDIEARLKNKRQLEARILKLLEEKAGELKDIVTVEGELARVREEIERIEGRLRFLASQVDLSTVSIYACEKEEYIPPTAPTFRERIAMAFGDSLRLMRELGEALVIAIVAFAPWLALLSILLGIVWIVIARVRRRMTPPVVVNSLR